MKQAEKIQATIKAADNLLLEQANDPVFLTNLTCDSLHDGGVIVKVFERLGLSFSWENVGIFPLTEEEQVFIGEVEIDGPYGGALFGPSYLYGNEKYIGPTVEICYDGPHRPFSVKNYGGFLLENSERAWEEAGRLEQFLAGKIGDRGACKRIEGAPDRHYVAIMFKPSFLIETFGSLRSPFDEFEKFVGDLFEGYQE